MCKEENQNCAARVFKTFTKTFMTVSKCITEMHDGNKYNLRTIEAQTVQKLKNNEARPKFTGSYKKKCVYY